MTENDFRNRHSSAFQNTELAIAIATKIHKELDVSTGYKEERAAKIEATGRITAAILAKRI